MEVGIYPLARSRLLRAVSRLRMPLMCLTQREGEDCVEGEGREGRKGWNEKLTRQIGGPPLPWQSRVRGLWVARCAASGTRRLVAFLCDAHTYNDTHTYPKKRLYAGLPTYVRIAFTCRDNSLLSSSSWRIPFLSFSSLFLMDTITQGHIYALY